MTQKRKGGRGSKRHELPKGFITRKEAAQLLGLSVSAVRRMDGIQLTPTEFGGAVYYQAHEVELIRKERAGEDVSAAFGLFLKGGTAIDAVVQLGVDPQYAQHLWDGYLVLRKTSGKSVFIEFPDAVSTEAWRRTFGLQDITPEMVKIALEAAAMDPATRARMKNASAPSEHSDVA